MSIIIFIISKNQIENINAQIDEKNNENIVIINKDKCKSYNIVKSKNKKNENIITIIIAIIIENDIKNKNENINIKNIINDNEK